MIKAARIAVFFLLIASICHAKFTVVFKDGTSRDVTKIEFKGDRADLYLVTGMTMTVPVASIDFKTSGIQEPSSAFGVVIYGKGEGKPKETKTTPAGPSQDLLRSQWEGSTETAIAIEDFGSIKKGDLVKIVSRSNFSITIVAKAEDGSYKRLLVSGETFNDKFEEKVAKKSLHPGSSREEISQKKPEASQPVIPKSEAIEIAPAPRRVGPKPSLIPPVLLAAGLLAVGFAGSVLLSKTNQPRRKKRVALKS